MRKLGGKSSVIFYEIVTGIFAFRGFATHRMYLLLCKTGIHCQLCSAPLSTVIAFHVWLYQCKRSHLHYTTIYGVSQLVLTWPLGGFLPRDELPLWACFPHLWNGAANVCVGGTAGRHWAPAVTPLLSSSASDLATFSWFPPRIRYHLPALLWAFLWW